MTVVACDHYPPCEVGACPSAAQRSEDGDGGEERGLAVCYREAAFEVIPHDDGQILEGYAAVFNSPAVVRDRQGDFEETILPGAFTRSLRERPPVVMFDHGKHPLIGSLPLGPLIKAEEDSRGLYIRARLSDNWLIQPFRDAIRDGAVTGMSFRFTTPKGGDSWGRRADGMETRAVREAIVPELGPVPMPVYRMTTAQVRSYLDCIDCDLTGQPAENAGSGEILRAAPGNGNALVLPLDVRVRDRMLRWNMRSQLNAGS